MSLNIISKKLGGGDQSWLGSRHGVENAQTGTLSASAFVAAVDGVVPSGTPVKEQAGKLVPAGSDAPLGFTLVNASVKHGDEPVAYVWHGRIKTQKLPVATFTVPSAPGAFTYVGGNKEA